MKFAVIFCLLILTLTEVPAGSTLYTLYGETSNHELNTPQYLDRANYIQSLSDVNNHLLEFSCANDTVSGPFKFHLKIDVAPASADVHYVSIYAMQTVKDGTSSKNIPITLFSNNTADWFDYFYSVAISEIETTFLPDPLNDASNPNGFLSFTSKLTFYFMATELDNTVLYLTLECPIILRRPTTVSGTYSDIMSVMLENTFNQISINVEVASKLEACKQEATYPALDYTTCTSFAAGQKLSLALNNPAKFQLSLIDETFKRNYYLTKYKITLQSSQMRNPVDFTTLTTQPNTYLGKMIFSLIMSIVGDQITVTATGVLSMTATRRILETESSKAAIGMVTASVSKPTSATTTLIDSALSPVSIVSWIIGIVSLFILI